MFFQCKMISFFIVRLFDLIFFFLFFDDIFLVHLFSLPEQQQLHKKRAKSIFFSFFFWTQKSVRKKWFEYYWINVSHFEGSNSTDRFYLLFHSISLRTMHKFSAIMINHRYAMQSLWLKYVLRVIGLTFFNPFNGIIYLFELCGIKPIFIKIMEITLISK